ncbi:MAG: hypothetical protein ACLGP3_07645 [Acidobacteriota bacterium]
MDRFLNGRRLGPGGLAILFLCVAGAAAQNSPSSQSGASSSSQKETIPRQNGTPLPLNPDLPGMHRNHRLILKDGSYQLVTQYQIVGDRVRYFSQERADWEEIPADLVDWDATRKWERDHATLYGDSDTSEGMKEAEAVDKAELAARDEQKARTPTVAPGLDLPDQDGVFVLDTFQGTQELVELPETDIKIDQKKGHGLGILNPMAGMNAEVELDGRHSRIHLHVSDPAIYLSLANPDDNTQMMGHAIMVKTNGARAVNDARGAHGPQSGFAVVKVDERNAVRIVGAVHLGRDGAVTQSENVIPAKSTVMPGKHWLRIQPDQPLAIGEYALIEILSPTDISPTVWDFRVDPTKGDNPGALTPILQPVDARQ